MPKSVLLAPWSDKDGKPHAAGEEVDLTDEEYAELRLDGKVANIKEPYEGEPGHYGDVTTRSDVTGTPAAPEPLNAPSKDDDDDEPANRTRRR
jgi:hypothetical protein